MCSSELDLSLVLWRRCCISFSSVSLPCLHGGVCHLTAAWAGPINAEADKLAHRLCQIVYFYSRETIAYWDLSLRHGLASPLFGLRKGLRRCKGPGWAEVAEFQVLGQMSTRAWSLEPATTDAWTYNLRPSSWLLRRWASVRVSSCWPHPLRPFAEAIRKAQLGLAKTIRDRTPAHQGWSHGPREQLCSACRCLMAPTSYTIQHWSTFGPCAKTTYLNQGRL